MKYSMHFSYVVLVLLLAASSANATLSIKIAEPKTYGQKSVVKMDLRNTFANAIESARAVVFLLDDTGKVVGQETRWIIGGTKDKRPLASDAKTTFNFVVQSNKPFTKTKVSVTRLVLEGGKVVDGTKDVQIESELR